MPGIHGIQGWLLRPVDGLLFGLEGVLFDDGLWRRWLFRLLGDLGVRTDYDAFSRRWHSRYLRPVCRGQSPLSEAFRGLLFSYNLTSAQVGELTLACYSRWRQQQRESRPLPGVRRTLLPLSDAGLVLGVLSDSECSGRELRRRLADAGLQDVFVSVTSSIDLGRTKPDTVGYLHSARQMRLDPRAVAFVGQRADELAGATSAGMQTIALRPEPRARADVHLARIEQLSDLFGHRRRYAAAG
ncbi:MAG TPA: HAD hydrolase-like protein [Thermoguttaceae bacterium]|nr:HAD hydrolase-like protein [Thermoguttaceae bacterium]